MKPLSVCPSTLAEGFDTYSPAAPDHHRSPDASPPFLPCFLPVPSLFPNRVDSGRIQG